MGSYHQGGSFFLFISAKTLNVFTKFNKLFSKF
jgi:hypothetical protein